MKNIFLLLIIIFVSCTPKSKNCVDSIKVLTTDGDTAKIRTAHQAPCIELFRKP